MRTYCITPGTPQYPHTQADLIGGVEWSLRWLHKHGRIGDAAYARASRAYARRAVPVAK